MQVIHFIKMIKCLKDLIPAAEVNKRKFDGGI